MKNILLPTDFSENSWNAIRYALSFFEKQPCNFYVLHVSALNYNMASDVPHLTTQDAIEDFFIKPAKRKLRGVLERISTEVPSNKNHKFFTLTDYNFFIESIRTHVDQYKIDFIVMGTKGASGLKKIIIGSNTGDVITKVKCTTLAIPENATFKEPDEIAFLTDFSISYDIEVLHPLTEILEQQKAALKILHIKKNSADLDNTQNKNKGLLEDYFNHLDYDFHFVTSKKIEDALQCFVESRHIDMVCMVAKNLNYFQQIFYHNKVEAISYHTEIPFLVVHEKN